MADEFVPVIEIPIEATDNRTRLLSALSAFAAQDAQFRFTCESEAGAAVLIGIDELQLDRKIHDLRNVHHIEVSIGPPQVAFRETIRSSVEVDYTHKRRSGSAGEFARVKLVLDPPGIESKDPCEIKVADITLPDEYAAGVRTGVNVGLLHGVVAGFPLVGVTVTLVDAAHHDVDSSAAAFAAAANAALRDGLKNAGSVLLEPIMRLKISLPDDCIDGIIDDLMVRRGRIVDHDQSSIVADVPAVNLFGYANSLRSMSNGRATYSVQFDHRAQIPPPDDPPFPAAIGMRA
jgi:elongation factor G